MPYICASMNTTSLSTTPFKYLLALFIILGATFCIYTPNFYLFKMGARFAGLIMLSYLALGLIFLFFKQSGLMLTSFICCAGICLFLKNASYADLTHAAPVGHEMVKIAHYNVSSISDPDKTIQDLLEMDVDLISLQDLTPDWHYLLKETLGEKYPYQESIVRFDPYGLALFSKFPISQTDTFSVAEVPNIISNIKIGKDQAMLRIIAAHTSPPLYTNAYSLMQDQVKAIGQKVNDSVLPCLVVGNFNAPPWWGEMQGLREIGNLMDSRRSVTFGLTEIFQSPGDYLLYTPKLKCVDFKNLYAEDNAQVGIMGTYQFNPDAESDEAIF